MVDLAQAGYLAYGDAVEWKNYRGDPMPQWFELPEAIRVAWRASADAIVALVDLQGLPVAK